MRRTALTLVELVVSLAIIAVVGTVVLVSFTILDRRRLETAARNLIADLSWARQMAVSRHQNYTVTFNQTGAVITDGCGNVLEPESYSITDAACRLLDSARPIQRLGPVDITACPDTLVFESYRGTISLNPPGSNIIRLEQSGRSRQIRVFVQTGYVRMD